MYQTNLYSNQIGHGLRVNNMDKFGTIGKVVLKTLSYMKICLKADLKKFENHSSE